MSRWNQQRSQRVELCKPNCMNIVTTFLQLFGSSFLCKLGNILLSNFRELSVSFEKCLKNCRLLNSHIPVCSCLGALGTYKNAN